MPTVVGLMMPFRSGYACSRPCVSSKDFWSSSLPYAVLTSLSFEYSGFESSSFMNLIQVFWLVAFGVAERIAISPPSGPICLDSSCTWLRPRSSAAAWLMKMSRPAGSVSESYVTTLMPAALAFSSAGTTAFGSLAEMTIASCFCVVSVLMYDTCEDAVASGGPTRLNSPPKAFVASSPPLSEIVKYGLLICFGRKAIFRPGLISPPAAALVAALVAAGVAADSLSLLSFVEPQAATTNALATAKAAIPREPIMVDISLLTGVTRLWWVLGVCRRRVPVAAPHGRGR